MKRILFFFLILIIITVPLFAQEVISKIDVVGNSVVSDATVLSKIKTRPQQKYNKNVINEDIKVLYSTGYFENIQIDKENLETGVLVKFIVKEKPVIEKINIQGNRRIGRKRIEKIVDIKEGSFLNEYNIKEKKNSIRDFYAKKGFSNVDVSYDIKIDKDNKANVTYIISEGGLARVEKIIIKGNVDFSDKKIKKIIHTKERGFLRRGVFKEQTLADDLRRLEHYYRERGYSEIKVDSTTDYIGNKIFITITLNEGQLYKIGRIKIEGNEKIDTKTLEEELEIKVEDVFVRRKIDAEVNKLKGVYVDRGYIFANIRDVVFYNPQTKKMDITFSIKENDLAYVEEIHIKGNVKTKDEVIRRELRIFPGDKFAGKMIKKSKQRLENLGFFEEVRFDSQAGSKPNWEDLIVDVKEAKTGYLSFGGGYSSIDALTGFIEVRQRNFDYKNWSTFTGGGQDLNFVASFGSITEKYELSFANPWIFDKPITLGLEAYKKGHDRDEDVGYAYQEDIKGGAIRLMREFTDELKAGAGYRFETVDISDVSTTASSELQQEKGTNDFSSIELDCSYDTRDNIYVPSTGLYFGSFLKFTGDFLGGDKDFVKFVTRFNKYWPLPKDAVLEFKIKTGIAETLNNTSKLPLYERFFAGGASTIRGYHERKIGPIDSVTEDPIGGEGLFVANIEYTYPLVDVLKVAVFADTGNVWKQNDDYLSGGLKSSVGIGIRVKTPLGPLSLDYGWPLDTEPGEDGKSGRFHFNISRGF